MREQLGNARLGGRNRPNAPATAVPLPCSTLSAAVCAALFAALSAALFANLATAAEPRFVEFIDANPVLEDTVCAYTTSTTSSEYPDETRVERFSPTSGWRLIAVNDQPPTEQAMEEYAGAAKQRRGRRQEPLAMDFADMARADSVTVADEDADTITFSFIPGGDDNEAMMENMNGLLVVAKDTLRPLRISLELTEPASPAPTVKLQSFRQEMTFAVEPATGAAMMSSMTMAMRGKAFVFKKIDSETQIAVSDYDCRRE